MKKNTTASNKKKTIAIVIFILLAILGGMIYYLNRNKLEDYTALEKKLPQNKKEAIAYVTKIDKRNAIRIRDKSYTNGYLYTYVFSAKNKQYMGNDFLKTVRQQINDTVTIIFLPENPSVNEFKYK